MNRFAALYFFSLFVALTFLPTASAQTPTAKTAAAQKRFAVSETSRIIVEIVKESYPELANAKIKVETFESRSDFFRSQFSVARFLTFRRPHFVIFVNPQIFSKGAPPDGVRAIIAHELAHTDYYRRHNRFELLGLIALKSQSFTVRFERGADLQAIKRGYGEGLKSYREWLYRNIPAKKTPAKKRDYFSPEEIDLILAAMKENPSAVDDFIKKVPRDLAAIKAAI